MKFLQQETVLGAECADDAVKSAPVLEGQLAELEEQLAAGSGGPERRRGLLLDIGYTLLDLQRPEEAWQKGWEVFGEAIPAEAWEQAVQACEILYKAERPDSLKALAHGIWLGVTYPVDPELSVAMLQHLIDDTPPTADGAAVAATVARYIVDLRAEGKQRDDLLFYTGQQLGEVARRHRNVDDQETFDFWFKHLELDDPGVFLPRLGQMLDALVADAWWFDRDELRAKLPD